MNTPKPINAKPICPKCGYDQSGEIATWESSCPVDGRCPECGLAFAWADVMDPARTALWWYVEHASSTLGIIKRSAGTLRRLALPWVFWRLVGFESAVRLKVLGVWAVMLMIGVHLLVSIPAGMGFWHVASIRYYGSLGNLYQNAGFKGLLMPVINALGSPFIDVGVSYRTGELTLFSGFSSDGVMRDAFLTTFPFIGMTLLWMIVLLVMPTTRRRAKIRSAHVLRAGLISAMTIFFAFELSRGAHGLDMFASKGVFVGFAWERALTESMIPIMMIWVLVFWASAIRVGWKIRPSGLLISMGSIASLLGGFAIYYVMSMYFDWM